MWWVLAPACVVLAFGLCLAVVAFAAVGPQGFGPRLDEATTFESESDA